VNAAAYEGKKEIRQDARAARHELDEAMHDLSYKTGSKEKIARAREMVREAKNDIREEQRDALDSIDDIREEYRSGKTRSAQKTIAEIRDIVEETFLDIDTEV
jgi:DNA anti-recombination protein RmuC